MYFVNNRAYSVFAPLPEELQYDERKNYLFDLSYLGVMDVIGEKASEFLQGQLSCDIREINTQHMRQAIQCNLQGRILSLLDVVDWDGMRLVIPNDLMEITQASLTKTALLSRVTLQPSSQIHVLGFLLNDASNLLPPSVQASTTSLGVISNKSICSYRLDTKYYLLLVDNQHFKSITEPFVQKNQWRGSLAWHSLQLEQARLELYPESRALFLPHRLNLHNTGYINFNKGCYKGQEIIARTQYRATLKHGLRIARYQTASTLQSGMKLIEPQNQSEIGELIDFCPLGNNLYQIAASVLLNYSGKISELVIS